MKKQAIFLAIVAILAMAVFSGCPGVAGDRLFWVNDLGNGFEQLDAKLVYQNERCNVYVRVTDLDKISEALCIGYGDYFRDVSYPNVTANVYAPEYFFGEAGNRINIFFYDMGPEGPAGYFWSKDLYEDNPESSYRSNETNVFYMNILSAVDPADQASATAFSEGTLTHEFQHMCNAHYFYMPSGPGYNSEREMDSWANEFCSVMMESMYAGQYPIYVGAYNQRSSFSTGDTAFLYWDNNFTQYTAVSLIGGYILSELADDVARGNVVKTFLEKTNGEDNDPAAWDSTPDYVFATSVHDLIAALQDSDVGYSGRPNVSGDWTTVANVYAADAGVGANWNVIMKRFLIAMTSGKAAFKTFLSGYDYTGTFPNIEPRLLASGTTSVGLKMSAFAIGTAYTADMNSDLKPSSTSAANAYALFWNGAIPSADRLYADSNTLPEPNMTFASNVIKKATPDEPATKALTKYPTLWNRASGSWKPSSLRTSSRLGPSGDTDIPGDGNTGNGSDGAGGYLYCAYTPN